MDDHKSQALVFLSHGPDTVGVINSEEQMAAVLVFSELVREGYVKSTGLGENLTFSLTDEGVEQLLTNHPKE